MAYLVMGHVGSVNVDNYIWSTVIIIIIVEGRV
jgi:hypothetical protein